MIHVNSILEDLYYLWYGMKYLTTATSQLTVSGPTSFVIMGGYAKFQVEIRENKHVMLFQSKFMEPLN